MKEGESRISLLFRIWDKEMFGIWIDYSNCQSTVCPSTNSSIVSALWWFSWEAIRRQIKPLDGPRTAPWATYLRVLCVRGKVIKLNHQPDSPRCFNVVGKVRPRYKVLSVSLEDRQMSGLFVDDSSANFSTNRHTDNKQNNKNIHRGGERLQPERHVTRKKSYDHGAEQSCDLSRGGPFKIKALILPNAFSRQHTSTWTCISPSHTQKQTLL